jgi:hypothetical protein
VQDRSLDFADVIDLAIDQSLTKVSCCFAGVCGQARFGAGFAYRNLRQIADLQCTKIRGCVGVGKE